MTQWHCLRHIIALENGNLTSTDYQTVISEGTVLTLPISIFPSLHITVDNLGLYCIGATTWLAPLILYDGQAVCRTMNSQRIVQLWRDTQEKEAEALDLKREASIWKK